MRADGAQEPYELPLCRLSVHDAVSGQQVAVSPLELFDDAAQLGATLGRNPRARVLLLRHFAPEQANDLLRLGAAKAAAAAAGEEGEEGADESWKVLEQDVRGLRSELLEPELVRLAAEAPAAAAAGAGADAVAAGASRFEALRDAWRQPAKAANSLSDVLSQKGVTLVATLEPRRVALELAGRWTDEARWAEEARAVRAKVREAAAAKRAADKARERAAKRGDEDGGGRAGGRDDGLGGAGRVRLRPGVEVWADEADEVADSDTLVMLSKGVAYAGSKGVEPLVKQLYQQALLYIPERADVRPPLHTLVVDYSAVYGTDCPAVDTIVLCADLGERLSWEDHQQFLGRLRRDGTAVYPSMELLRRAALGGGVRQWEQRRRRREDRQRAAVEAVLAPHVAPAATPNSAAAAADGGDATTAAARELLRLVRPGNFTRSDVGRLVLAAALRDLVAPAPPLAGDAATADAAAAAVAEAPERELGVAAVKRLQRWGRTSPVGILERLRLERPGEQRRLVEALEELCVAAPEDGGAAAAPPPATARLLPFAARLLQELANEDLVERPALDEWCAEAERRAGPTGGPPPAAGSAAARGAAFRQAAVRVRDWLAENESDEEGEGSDEE
ncbi:hypothetical protein GPECTOR_5g22 [Gonium pectorale]|uniref:W2 domain-containing protein n=1 Tax=Gonium pectorale TaxID=33097 RepID=A0A150GWR7_GONPE|nr:hypothetical protein GPECTOR_5g22 [Gonium pectorale]|eukprot:KXZ54118.1 hypothetical protein GPECTOR_5g22 [Gonium pectorale]